jgi:molecular chaperone GrpE
VGSRDAKPGPDGAPGEEAVRQERATEEDRIDGATADAASPAPDAAEPEAEPRPEEPDEEEDPLTQAQRERDEYLEVAQRAQADLENYRKRAAREAAAAGERARSGLVRELLPVVDNLERALASAGAEEDHLADGVRLVHSELVAVLERNGVTGFDPVGEPFDPNVHEALSTRNEEGATPGVVLDVVERGYRLGESVLRPARVVVSG